MPRPNARRLPPVRRNVRASCRPGAEHRAACEGCGRSRIAAVAQTGAPGSAHTGAPAVPVETADRVARSRIAEMRHVVGARHRRRIPLAGQRGGARRVETHQQIEGALRGRQPVGLTTGTRAGVLEPDRRSWCVRSPRRALSVLRCGSCRQAPCRSSRAASPGSSPGGFPWCASPARRTPRRLILAGSAAWPCCHRSPRRRREAAPRRPRRSRARPRSG